CRVAATRSGPVATKYFEVSGTIRSLPRYLPLCHNIVTGGAMTRSQEYRRTGEDYVQIADKCRYSEHRTLWLSLARAWFKLADDTEQVAGRYHDTNVVPFARDQRETPLEQH